MQELKNHVGLFHCIIYLVKLDSFLHEFYVKELVAMSYSALKSIDYSD